MTQPLRIVFAGTPDFAAQHLAALLSSEHDVIAVYTQPDKPAGRGKKLTASPVKQIAMEHGIDVYQPESFKNEQAQQELARLNADVMIVVAYGQLLPKVVLDTPRLGCINIHFSILPRWRGAAPIQRAIWAGDQEAGVTIMQMDVGLDTGDILKIAKIPVEPNDTSSTMFAKLAQLGPQALLECLTEINQGKVIATPQDDAQANYAKKLSKEEARIQWAESAEHIERCVRAFNPWPVSHFEVQEQTVKVWQSHVRYDETTAQPGTIVQADKNGIVVATGQGQLVLEHIQIPGKKAMPVADVLNSKASWFEVGQLLN